MFISQPSGSGQCGVNSVFGSSGFAYMEKYPVVVLVCAWKCCKFLGEQVLVLILVLVLGLVLVLVLTLMGSYP